ncbi:DMT family transporter [Aquincola sp. S2]|uniref:DMT family transporter n=1 Tax=Pseudaquabacterium terrae TaxID=2732868 RepID=A0ABX2EFC9_9BURK|nr:DMT family transporter [Aquabacterium terrae]NRF67313.1 DMT family transporter [Aquabacterium terrae]
MPVRSNPPASMGRRAIPFLFVLLWSTGFIGARLGLPHAPPLLFLVLRYLAVIALMTMVALVMRAPWPRGVRAWASIGIAGLLVHGLYLGGVFIAISQGLPAGVTSLVVGLQPLLTAMVAVGWMGERLGGRRWFGLALGFAGVALVVSRQLDAGFGAGGLPAAVLALLAITAGTLWQKRWCPSFDWRTGLVVQFIPATLATAVAAALTEPLQLRWTGEFVFALGWLVFVLSLGAVSLLNALIRAGSAVDSASLFYLVPPSTALFAWGLFGERLTGAALLGMALTVAGVWLARLK